MYIYEEKKLYRKPMMVLALCLMIAITVLKLTDVVPYVLNALKLFGVVVCFLYAIMVSVKLGADFDRVSLCVAFFFAAAGVALLLFTKYVLYGIICLCLMQEFHSIRIFSIKKSVVRMDGRTTLTYHGYKIWKRVLVLNLIQLAAAAIVFVVSRFVTIHDIVTVCAAVFYIVGFVGNLLPLEYISKDMRLLDDIRPLKVYFIGMLICFIGDVLLGVMNIPAVLGKFEHFMQFERVAYVVVWILYITGMFCIALSSNRSREFYT